MAMRVTGAKDAPNARRVRAPVRARDYSHPGAAGASRTHNQVALAAHAPGDYSAVRVQLRDQVARTAVAESEGITIPPRALAQPHTRLLAR